MKINRKRIVQGLLYLLAGLLVSCVLLTLIAYISNQSLPSAPEVTDRLDKLDKARLAEALQLKGQLGGTVWPGWGDNEIPVLLWNQDYEFLIGLSDPPKGWETVPNDTFHGEQYYRRTAEDPQNFAVRLGDRWVASIATKYETDAFLQGIFRDALPSVLEGIFPYRLLILPSEVQITALLHESFHVQQVQVAVQKFSAAKAVYPFGERYWDVDASMRDAWEAEVALLEAALEARTQAETAEIARQYLAQRDRRRMDADLNSELLDFERCLEWLEGLAKYVELAIWREAYQSPDYQPLMDIMDDPEFKEYATFDRRWSQEISQMKRQSEQAGDTRFYYTGMAQAHILDRLMPDWKNRAMQEGVFLEDLLRETLE
ncbi:MAG: hypothetical protein PVG32_08070 [Anaerolineales bacterium]|jgi:hypothetical protein